MDIGKHYAQFGSPVLLTLVLLIIIPSSTGYIDCRISCRRCHENSEHPAVLEVYCAMCEECKQRRRERMLGRTTKGKIKPTLKSLVRMRDGAEVSTNSEALIIRPQEALQQAEQGSQQQYQGQPQQPLELQQLLQPQQPPQEVASQKALRGMVYPPGCPTPPICSDSEEETDVLIDPEKCKDIITTTPTTTTTTMTTTTITTQPPPCPPVETCRKKKKTQHPCMNPCMVSPAMCPCPLYPPPAPQVPGYLQPCPQRPGYMPLPPPGPSYMSPSPPDPNCIPLTLPQTNPPLTSALPVINPSVPCAFPPVPGECPGKNSYWPIIPPPLILQVTNQPCNQQTQTTENGVLDSTMNEDFHYVYIGLPKNTI